MVPTPLRNAAATYKEIVMQRENSRPKMSCDTCKLRKKAEQSPSSFLGRLWIWHTAVCPGWKKYVKTMHAHGENPPAVGHLRGVWSK